MQAEPPEHSFGGFAFWGSQGDINCELIPKPRPSFNLHSRQIKQNLPRRTFLPPNTSGGFGKTRIAPANVMLLMGNATAPESL